MSVQLRRLDQCHHRSHTLITEQPVGTARRRIWLSTQLLSMGTQSRVKTFPSIQGYTPLTLYDFSTSWTNIILKLLGPG